MKELVILDLDGVIIKGQSQLLFLSYLFKKRFIGLFFYLRIYLWFILYKLELVKNPEKIINFAYSFLRDKKTEDITEVIEDFFDEKLQEFIFLEIIDIINKHRVKNRELLIISNAVDILVKKIAKFLNIHNYIGTKLEITDGIFTGKILGNIVYGKNKANIAKNFAEKNNLDLKNSWAYTDHISDLDLLLLASKPYAVNPDKFLLIEAKKRNWPILIFKNTLK